MELIYKRLCDLFSEVELEPADIQGYTIEQFDQPHAGAVIYNGQLTELQIVGTPLTKLPDLSEFKSLKRLLLYQNKLRDLPESIGELINLEELYLNMNQLTGLPESIKNLTNLKTLYLYMNQLEEFPPGLRGLTSLEELDIYENPISSVPEWISELSSLKRLYLSDTKITSLPESITSLSLTELNLFGTNLTKDEVIKTLKKKKGLTLRID